MAIKKAGIKTRLMTSTNILSSLFVLSLITTVLTQHVCCVMTEAKNKITFVSPFSTDREKKPRPKKFYFNFQFRIFFFLFCPKSKTLDSPKSTGF